MLLLAGWLAGGPSKSLRVGVVHGTAQTRALLDKITSGEEK